MQIVLDLNLASRHEMLPDEFKDKILRKTGHGFLFTALQPILETLHFLKNPSEQEHKAIPGSSVLMAGGENGRERQPFFIVRKKSVLP